MLTVAISMCIYLFIYIFLLLFVDLLQVLCLFLGFFDAFYDGFTYKLLSLLQKAKAAVLNLIIYSNEYRTLQQRIKAYTLPYISLTLCYIILYHILWLLVNCCWCCWCYCYCRHLIWIYFWFDLLNCKPEMLQIIFISFFFFTQILYGNF